MADANYSTKITVEADTSQAEKKIAGLANQKPVEVTIAVNDDQVKARLKSIVEEQKIKMTPAGMGKDGEQFKVEFQPDDAKVKAALREVTASKHTVIVGMRAKWEQAQGLYAELQKPIRKAVAETAQKAAEETARKIEQQVPPASTAAPSASGGGSVPPSRPTIPTMSSGEYQKHMREAGDAAEAAGVRGKNAFFQFTGAVNKTFYALRAFNRLLLGMSVFSTIMIVVNAVKALYSWIGQTARKWEEFSRKAEADRHASAVESLTNSYKRLYEQIKLVADTEARLNKLDDRRTSLKRGVEDTERERKKTLEIAKLNPYAYDYDEQKRAIERRYAKGDADIAARRSWEDSRTRQERLADAASAKDKEVKDLNALLVRARAEKQLAFSGGDEKAFAESVRKVNEIVEKIAEAEREAMFLRAEQQAESGSYDAAQQRAENEKRKIDTEARRESAKREQDALLEDDKRQKREEEARSRAERDAKIEGLSKRERELADFAGGFAGVGGVSQNRLTAMGLGAGVSGPVTGIASDVKKLVDLARAQLDAAKKKETAVETIQSLF